MGRLTDILPEIESFEVGREKDSETYFVEWKFNLLSNYDNEICDCISSDAIITVWFDENRCITFNGKDCIVEKKKNTVVVTSHNIVALPENVVCGMWIENDVFCDLFDEYNVFPSIDLYIGEYAKQIADFYDIALGA